MAEKKPKIEIEVDANLTKESTRAFEEISTLFESLGKGNAKKVLDTLFNKSTKDLDSFIKKFKVFKKEISITDPKIDTQIKKIDNIIASQNRNIIASKKNIQEMLDISEKLANPLLASNLVSKYTNRQNTLSNRVISRNEKLYSNKQDLSIELDGLKKYHNELVKTKKIEVEQETKNLQVIDKLVNKEQKQIDLHSQKNEKIKQYSIILNEVANKYNTHAKMTKGLVEQEKLIVAKKQELNKLSGPSLIAGQKELENEKLKLKAMNELYKTQKSTIKDAFTNAFSMEKMLNRIAFVITAKLSYEAFDAFTRFFREGLQNSILLEQHLMRIASITKGQNQGILKTSAKESIGMGFQVSDINQAMYQSASAQFTNEETVKLMQESAKMAVAGFTSQTDAMDALTTTLRAYKLGTEDATRVSDWFFKVIELGKTELKDLAPDIGKIASTADLLGISMEEVGTALSTMTMKGIKTNVAITSLNQLFMNLVKPTQEAKGIMEKYNLNLDLSAIKTQGLAKTIQQLNVLTDEEIATLASSRNGFRALAVAINDTGLWQENYNKIVNASGSTQKAFADQTETTAFKLSKLKGEIILVGMEFGEVLIKLAPLLTIVSNLIKGVSGELGAWIVGLTVVSSTIMLKVIPAISALITTGTKMQITFGILGVAVVGLTYVLGKLQSRQEEIAKFEKERSDEKLEELNKEKTALDKREELLLSYNKLKEQEITKEGISKRQKDLLLIIQDQLTKSYGDTNEELKDANKLLDINTQKQIENFEASKAVKLSESRIETLKAKSYLKDFGIGDSRIWSNTSSPETKLSLIKKERERRDWSLKGYDLNIEQSNDLDYVEKMTKAKKAEIDFYSEFMKALDAVEKESILLSQNYKKQEAKITELSTGGEEIDKDKLERERLAKKEKEARELRASLKKAFDTELDIYRLKGDNLNKLLIAQKAYIEVAKEEEAGTQNQIISAMNQNYEILVSNELNYLAKKEDDELEIISRYNNINNIFNKKINELKQISDSQIEMNAILAEQEKYRLKGQELTDKVVQTKALKSLQADYDSMTEEEYTLKTRLLGNNISPDEMKQNKLDKLSQYKGVLSGENYLEEEKKINDDYAKDKKQKDKELVDATFDEASKLANNLMNLWQNYLNTRLEQINMEKQARIDSIDEQAKTEFRSSWWVAGEKEKAEKKAEKERKKIEKTRKASAMAELTIAYAIALVKNWELTGPGALILNSLLTANYVLSMAMVTSQKLEKGGIIKGKRHKDGGVNVEVEGGEAVFSRKATQGNERALENMNVAMSNGMSLENATRQFVPTINTINNNQNNMPNGLIRTLERKLNSMVDAISNIQMNIDVSGQFLSPVQVSKMVDAGNSQRRRI